MQHLSQDEMEAFLQQATPANKVLEVGDHLASCAACRDAMETLACAGRPLPCFDLAVQEDAGMHLAEEELSLAGVNESALSPESRQHLQSCDMCREELRDAKIYAAASRVVQMPTVSRKPARFVWAGLAAVAAVAVVTIAVYFSGRSPESAPQLVAQLSDGNGVIGVDAAGRLRGLPAAAQDFAPLLSDALITHRLPAAQHTLPGSFATQRLRGEVNLSPGFDVLSPHHEWTGASPRFCWTALPGAIDYHVAVADSELHTASRSPQLTGTCWTTEDVLKPGETYSWTVVARTAHGEVQTPAPPMPEARFTVAAEDDLAMLAHAERQYPNSHLLMATLYARLGMNTLARLELSALRQENPQSSVVHDLEASIAKAD